MKEEALDNMRVFRVEDDAELVKAKLMKYQTQYNLAYMLENFPKVVWSVALGQEKTQEKIKAFKASQEGGTL